MAIEPMKRVVVLVPADGLSDFTSWLYRRSILHLTDVSEKLPENFQSIVRDGTRACEKISRLEQVFAFCEYWHGTRKGFLKDLFSAKTTAHAEELREAALALDPDELHDEMAELISRRESLMERLNAVERESERLLPFAAVEIPLASLLSFKRVHVALFRLSGPAERQMEQSTLPALICEKLVNDLFWVAFPQGDAEAIKFLDSIGAVRQEIPWVNVPVSVRLAALPHEKASVLDKIARLDHDCRQFSSKKEKVEFALGYWQSELHHAEGLEKMLSSKRIAVVRGYLPSRELETFSAKVRKSYSGEVLAEDPLPSEAVPVKIRTRPFFRPAELLVNMFGVPDYFSIDPTPFLTFSFLIFFGICFGDAVYGLALVALSLSLMRHFRANRGLRRFFLLFLYAGVSTFIFGALTGSWASDLGDHLPDNNILKRLRDSVPYFDPLRDPMFSLVIVIFIGIANQYFGIAMLIWRNWRRGDWRGVLYDGGLWYLYLTGLIILICGFFVRVPAALFNTGWVLLGLGAVGLLLTQGRAEKTLFARFAVGLVSLYGILGSYGATSFIGDTLSYSRLLALGLTTSIVGMSFNVLADVVKATPFVGMVLFIAVLIFGHSFNFFLSIIGSFVHPARLILLEFFGRFYELGGVKYKPFGFQTEQIEVIGGE